MDPASSAVPCFYSVCMLSLLNKNKYVNSETVNVEWKNYPLCEPKGYSAHNVRKLMAMDDVLCNVRDFIGTFMLTFYIKRKKLKILEAAKGEGEGVRNLTAKCRSKSVTENHAFASKFTIT